jgi:hypothetical protein
MIDSAIAHLQDTRADLVRRGYTIAAPSAEGSVMTESPALESSDPVSNPVDEEPFPSLSEMLGKPVLEELDGMITQIVDKELQLRLPHLDRRSSANAQHERCANRHDQSGAQGHAHSCALRLCAGSAA